jgi:glutathione S-transferase
MKLHGFPISPNTRKVRAVAMHLGIPLEFELIDLQKPAPRSPEYLALNPTGRTPTLVDGDFVLWESTAIMQYLADQKPGPLWPADSRTRADIVRWQSWQIAHWSEGCVGLTVQNVVKKLVGGGDPDPALVKRAEEAFHRDARVLDAHLARRSFLVGNGFTLADISVGAYLAFAGPAKIPLGGYGNIVAWLERLDAIPAWQETKPRM